MTREKSRGVPGASPHPSDFDTLVPMQPLSLARTLDALQQERNQAWRSRAERLEGIQMAQNRAACAAMAQYQPDSGASALEVGGGVALFMGVGSPLTQALGMGLQGPLTPEDLDRIEAHLTQRGGKAQFEVCPLADPGLFAALAARGYVLQEFQFAWALDLERAPAAEVPKGARIEPLEDGAAFLGVVMAGFMECAPEEVPREVLDLMTPTALAEGQQLWGAYWGDQLVGGGTFFVQGATAALSGASVLPTHRGRGLQGALIRARLAEAQRLGCGLVASGTAPNSPSQRNMERHGFRVAYPKVVLLQP